MIFALGIGGYKIEELNAAANDPDCTHMFLLQSFNEIDSILYQIRRSACTGTGFNPNVEIINTTVMKNIISAAMWKEQSVYTMQRKQCQMLFK